MNEKFLDNEQPAFNMDRSSKPSGAPAVILWITFLIALLGTVFLFFQSRSVANSVAEREQERDKVVTQLSSSSYLEIEKKANTFKAAFEAFSSVSANKLPKQELLNELYTHFTKDVKLNNISLSDDGALIVDGNTASYRSVADFITGLKAYDRITDLKLGGVSLNSGEDIPDNQRIVFSVTAKLDTDKKAVATEDSSTSSAEDAVQSGDGSAEDTSSGYNDNNESESTSDISSSEVTPSGAAN